MCVLILMLDTCHRADRKFEMTMQWSTVHDHIPKPQMPLEFGQRQEDLICPAKSDPRHVSRTKRATHEVQGNNAMPMS